MKKKALYLLIAISTLFVACRKSTPGVGDPGNNVPDFDTVYTSEHSKNLSVVYFIPSDNDTIANWHKRLSGVMLFGQKYVAENMQRAGYGYKTFGLLKDSLKGLIKIVLIKGKLTKEQYPENNASLMNAEINEYKASHPDEFTSAHVMVFVPAASYTADGNPDGVPIFGSGRWAYSPDYIYLDVNNKGSANPDENRGYRWISTIMHEFSHALNLPHNKEKVSDRMTPGLGYALMGPDMRKFANDSSFFTDADCAIFDVSETFQKNSQVNYYSAVSASIARSSTSFDPLSGSIIVSGKFTSDVPVKSVGYYLDPAGNDDYDAVTWKSNVIGTDSFYMSMPISELHSKGNTSYSLRIRLNHENGRATTSASSFSFLNGIPVFPNPGWRIIAYSSQESDFPASNLIDNNPNTYWRSAYTSTQAALPHSFRGDFGLAKSVSQVTLRQRVGVLKPVRNFEIQFSNQPGSGFVSAGTFVASAVNGVQTFNLSVPVTARYFRLVITSNHDGTNDSAIGEIGFE